MRQSLTHPIVRFAILAGACAGGCAATSMGLLGRGWVADYDTAEARVHESDQPLLIYFKDVAPGEKDRVRKILDNAPMRERVAGFVRCVLFRSHEPDRRYVAQFGVERAPALVVVHRDGTYHTLIGAMTGGDILDFLEQARPPGARPDCDPLIPRRAEYRWHDDLDRARRHSEDAARPMFVVYYRRFSSDWRDLHGWLEAREVHARVADMVHCRVGALKLLPGAYRSSFGALELPAVVIARPDGAFRVLERPTSSESLARFVDRSLEAAAPASAGSVPASAGSQTSP